MYRKSKLWIPLTLIMSALLTLNQLAIAEDAKKKAHVKVPAIGYRALPASAASKAGRLIFQKNNCAQCHTAMSNGGCLGPLLSAIGGRRSRKFILDRITAGQTEEREFAALYGQAELMPHPRLPRKQSNMVVSYLMTLPEPKGGFAIKPHATSSEPVSSSATDAQPSDRSNAQPSAQSIAAGKKLFYNAGCMSCHSIGKVGGQFAAELDDVGARKGRQYVSERMNGAEMLTLGTNDEYNQRGTSMPPSSLSPSQINSVTNFLMSLSTKK